MKKHLILWIIVLAALAAGVYVVWVLAKSGSLPSTTRIQTAAIVTALDSNDHFQGPENAKVTLIEYSDFQCPACRAYELILQQLRKDFGSSMVFAYRHFPLPQHANAELAARASEAAAKQGKFWEMLGLLFDKQDEWKDSDNAGEIFSRYAASLGLDANKFETDFNSVEVKNKVASDLKSANELYLNATPTFFLNGKKIANPQSYDEFKSLIQSALQKDQ